MQAREYAKCQNKEKCLYHLEQAVECVIGFIEYMRSESFVHTSLLWKQYDSVRADAGVVALTEKLSEYAGENDYKWM